MFSKTEKTEALGAATAEMEKLLAIYLQETSATHPDRAQRLIELMAVGMVRFRATLDFPHPAIVVSVQRLDDPETWHELFRVFGEENIALAN